MLEAQVLQKLGTYLLQHPEELVRAARNAALFKVGLPLAAVRWAVARSWARSGGLTQSGGLTRNGGQRLPRDVSLETVPPGLRIGMTVDLMGTELRGSAVVFIESLRLGPEELLIGVRVNEVTLTLLGESDSPLAALIRSGALDLGKIGNLVAVMPRRPAFLVEAKEDRIVLDLKRHPSFAGERLETLIGLITPLITVKGIATDREHIDVQFDVLSGGFAAALDAWKAALLSRL